MVEIPLPCLGFEKCRVVAGDTIERPVRRSNMNVIIGTISSKCCGLVPRPPVVPVDVRRIFIRWHKFGLIDIDRLGIEFRKDVY